jgi:hypothetical protein
MAPPDLTLFVGTGVQWRKELPNHAKSALFGIEQDKHRKRTEDSPKRVTDRRKRTHSGDPDTHGDDAVGSENPIGSPQYP